jgi:hypothetical protein
MENTKDRENRIKLTDQILWQNRKLYIDLFEQYLSSKMDAEQMVDNFLVLHRNHNNEIEGLPAHPERLKKIQITSKSEGFNDLIEWIFCLCETLDVEETDDNFPFSVSENWFRNEISLSLQELKDYD